jgi:hypothetical protein
VKQSDVGGTADRESSALSQLSRLCEKLDNFLEFPHCTVREWKKLTKHTRVLDDLASQAKSIVHKEFECPSLSLRRSKVDKGGRGVFTLSSVPKGQVVGLYPGEFATVFIPMAMIVVQRLRVSESVISPVDFSHVAFVC